MSQQVRFGDTTNFKELESASGTQLCPLDRSQRVENGAVRNYLTPSAGPDLLRPKEVRSGENVAQLLYAESLLRGKKHCFQN